jgi:hypothetical protein
MRHSGAQRIRRVGATLGFAVVLAGIGAPAALAQIGLPGTNDTVTGTTSQVTGTVEQTAETVAPVVDTATQTTSPAVESVTTTTEALTQSANETVAPVVESTTKTVNEVVKTANQTVAPVVQRVEETVTTIVPAAETVTPVVKDLVETVSSTANTARKTAARTRSAAPASSQPTSAAPTASAPTSNAATPSVSDEQQVATLVTDALPDAATTGRTPRSISENPTAPEAKLPVGIVTPLSSASAGDLVVTPNGAAPPPSMKPRSPLPGVPSGPLTALFGASASAGGGALVAFLAALAAALFLAAPGLGRRLRPRLAPWPQPIPYLSLERPG